MAKNIKDRGKDLVYIGFVNTEDEFLLDLLKDNGYYLVNKVVPPQFNKPGAESVSHLIYYPKGE